MLKRRLLNVFAVVLAGLSLAAGPSVGSAQENKANAKPPVWSLWGPDKRFYERWKGWHMSPWHRHRSERHWRFMNEGVPENYRNVANPYEFSPPQIAEGAKIYEARCRRCHGEQGMGGGEAVKDLTPSPALLAYFIHRPIAVDQFLLWTISEGGVAYDTEMPAYKDELSRDEIWKVISYMRAGFPGKID